MNGWQAIQSSKADLWSVFVKFHFLLSFLLYFLLVFLLYLFLIACFKCEEKKKRRNMKKKRWEKYKEKTRERYVGRYEYIHWYKSGRVMMGNKPCKRVRSICEWNSNHPPLLRAQGRCMASDRWRRLGRAAASRQLPWVEGGAGRIAFTGEVHSRPG